MSSKTPKKLTSNFQAQYKFLYDFVRNSLTGRYDAANMNGTLPVGEVTMSETFERLSSAELVDDDQNEVRKMVFLAASLKKFNNFRHTSTLH